MISFADPQFVRLALRVAYVLRLAVLLVAGLVLAGWVWDVRALREMMHPNHIAMNPMTAVCFALSAGSLWAVAPRPTPPLRRGIGVGCTLAILLICLAKLAALHTAIDLPVDRLLFPAVANTMAPNTALVFALIGMGLLLIDVPIFGRYWLPQPFVLLAAAVTLLSIVGYLYDVLSLYQLGAFIPMALNTALTFVLLIAAILLTRPLRQPVAILVSTTAGGTLARQLMPAAFIFPVCLGWLRLAGERADLYTGDFGFSAFVLLVVVIFNVLIWWSAVLIHQLDAERWRVRDLIKEQNVQLEATARSEREAFDKLKQAQASLVQSEKLASLGQLVAGVAHEINNPLAFVSNNLAVLQRDIGAVADLLEQYRAADKLLAEHDPALADALKKRTEEVDLEYTLGNYRQVMIRSREGLKRIQQIVKDLRDFARLDESDFKDADLNAGIESTLNIVRGQARKRRVEIQTDFAELPLVPCYPAKINQVIMNLITNAIDASNEGDTITITTTKQTDHAQITVRDTGGGMTPAVRDRIFDPFFTTKQQGDGMGLGLSISYGIIRDHGGAIAVDSEPGKGTTFTIDLPLQGKPAPHQA